MSEQRQIPHDPDLEDGTLYLLADDGDGPVGRRANMEDLVKALAQREGVWPIELTEPASWIAVGGRHGVGVAPGRYLIVPLSDPPAEEEALRRAHEDFAKAYPATLDEAVEKLRAYPHDPPAEEDL